MNLPIDHLSYSSISAYRTCGKAWKYRYLDKIPTPSSPVLVIGSVVHDTVEEIIRCNSLGIEEPDAAEFAAQALTERLERENMNNNTPELETAKNEALRVVTAPSILSEIRNIKAKVDNAGPMIERKVTLEVPEVDVPIVGYIDIILSDGTPADFKTSSKSWTQQKAESELQPVFYLAAMGQCGIPVSWNFRHLVMVKTLKPKFQILEHRHEPAELFRLFRDIQNVWESMTTGIFLPAAPGSWKCNPRYCEYWAICQGG